MKSGLFLLHNFAVIFILTHCNNIRRFIIIQFSFTSIIKININFRFLKHADMQYPNPIGILCISVIIIIHHHT